MAGFTVSEGAKYILDMAYNGTSIHRSAGDTLEIGLFVNTSGVSAGMSLANIEEPTAGGYTRKDITNTWSVSATSASHTDIDFTASGASFANGINGYFVATKGTGTTGTNAVLIHIEVDSSGPRTIQDGSIYRVGLSSDL